MSELFRLASHNMVRDGYQAAGPWFTCLNAYKAEQVANRWDLRWAAITEGLVGQVAETLAAARWPPAGYPFIDAHRAFRAQESELGFVRVHLWLAG